MKLCFDSVDEVRAFVKNELKGARKGKDEPDDAPSPLQPPQTGGAGPTWNPQGASPFGNAQPGQLAGQAGGASPVAGAMGGIDPAVANLVQRINQRIDVLVASGQSMDQMLGWFRNQFGPDAAAATMDQIKAVFMPRQSVPVLENIAKLMAA